MPNELEQFLSAWDRESKGTLKVLKTLPTDKYDLRPDPEGRSLGELAWHLSEVDAYITYGIEQGKFEMTMKPPNLERPRTVAELAPGYERVHNEAVARVRKLKPEDLNRTLTFFDGSNLPVNALLWNALLMHLIHHRGQLVLMCRIAGGVPPGLYGATREEMAAMMKAAQA